MWLLLPLGVLAVALTIGALRPGPDPEPPVVRGPRATRVVVDGDEARLEVSWRTLAAPGAELVLAGMVHVGDPSFYEEASAALEPCGVVLYEGLEPDPDAPPPSEEQRADALAGVGLVLQADALRPDARWVRSDLSVVEIRAALGGTASADRAEEWLEDRDRAELDALLAASAADERRRALVRLALVRGLGGPAEADDAWWDVVIGRRNRRVVDDLRLRSAERLGVVYGADHVPDLEARLRRAGWHRVDERWRVVVRVGLGELGLGPVQARQWLGLSTALR